MRAIVFLVLFLLTGCANYQYGDVTSRVLSAQAEYCATSDPYQRAIRMVLLQRAGFDIPADGVCVDILEAVNGRVSE